MSVTALYLSPHYDDACFSLGMTARAGTGGHLVNIFTRCNYTAVPDPAASTDEVTKIRDEEDRAFADRCGFIRHNLGLSDAPVLGLGPFDLQDIHQEVEVLEKAFIQFLYALLEKAEGSDFEIYCPLGIGRHRNHISVFLAVIKDYEGLREKSKIFFYEDLPYASKPEAREEAIKRLAYYFPQSGISRHVNQLTEDEFKEKIALVSLYASQHRGPVREEDFMPADPAAPFPHEAFWEVMAA